MTARAKLRTVRQETVVILAQRQTRPVKGRVSADPTHPREALSAPPFCFAVSRSNSCYLFNYLCLRRHSHGPLERVGRVCIPPVGLCVDCGRRFELSFI